MSINIKNAKLNKMQQQYGICLTSFIPLRNNMNESAEMDSQLLFGDIVIIKEEKGNWFYIEQIFDQCEGWIDKKEILTIDENEFLELKKTTPLIINKPSIKIFDKNREAIILGMGSIIYHYNITEGSATFAGKKYYFEKKDIGNITVTKQKSTADIACRLLNTSYLWGGKSFFGIDCSGLSQTAFRILGKSLPRNSSQQSEIGQTINFLSESQNGDLAFFDNEEGKINHVGILLNNETIIHASGKVRIDKIDHHGIYNESIKKYTHNLRLIKRII